MHILYIHQYFITPSQQGGTRSYEFARLFIEAGHTVTMITSGLMNPEFPVEAGKEWTEYEHEGIRIISVAAGYNDARAGTGMGGIRRVIAFHRFAWAASRIGKLLHKPDIVFATHTPLTVGLSGMHLSQHFDTPFIFEVRDLWPDALINIGALKNPVGIAYLRFLERKFYRAADHIIALSPGMKQGVLRQGIADEKVTVVPNSSDLSLFEPANDGSEYRDKLGLGDRLAAIYFGAMGVANGLDYALQAAMHLKHLGRNDIVIVLHGEGGEKDRLKKIAADEELDNVVFSNSVPKKADMAKIVAACDVCLTIYKATKEVTWSPNKLFDALAAGRPVVINVGEWLGGIVEDNKCGYSVSPEDPIALANALIALADDPKTRYLMASNARKTAEDHFSRESLAAKIEDVFRNAINVTDSA